ncbi:lipopolysaccharide heptosyltransferase family protein [Sinomicrobium pectinilyticum]|uniref:Lipopolysaccharide heptosyltransferase family protein n=1 Tax=Sinomicrobium pectinilyticum TaxID=1084421 RepID=A0A3N0ELY7_SINP1|nr:glycosyltransferase family 9 protein [Sinomicrobium pectinilyticum]RNL88679.1 lipopolysaccharide heptosyltransferase family protein [Sinomicrobium pectinilyticum]
MGDVAMTVPVLQTLVKQHPYLRITVLSRAFFRPVFDGIPGVSFYGADIRGKHKGIPGLYRLYRELKGLGIDAVADLHNVLRSKILRLFFLAGGFRVVQIDKGRGEKKALTRERNKVFVPLKTTHRRYADVFEKLGYGIDMSRPVFSEKRELTGELRQLLGAEELTGRKTIGIAPFAAFRGKMYPPDLMEEVIRKLDEKGKYTLLLFGGGKEEKKALDALQSRYAHVVNVAGKLSFEQELALISNLDVMVAMDSGNAHLAAIYGVRTITLWGVTHPYAGFYPFGQDMDDALLPDREKYPLIPTSVYGNKFPGGYEDVMRTISPDEVVEKILKGI